LAVGAERVDRGDLGERRDATGDAEAHRGVDIAQRRDKRSDARQLDALEATFALHKRDEKVGDERRELTHAIDDRAASLGRPAVDDDLAVHAVESSDEAAARKLREELGRGGSADDDTRGAEVEPAARRGEVANAAADAE
jgi:hypothetical protein